MKSIMRKTSMFVLTGVVALALTGCGTLFWKERKNQPSSGNIDAQVMILDCCGLLFGIIPGVIALALDFSNDTIYYTKAEWAAKGK